MAIDTAEKRRSAAHVTFARGLPGVTPNAAKDIDWRSQAARVYSGNSDDMVVGGGGPGAFITSLRRRRRLPFPERR